MAKTISPNDRGKSMVLFKKREGIGSAAMHLSESFERPAIVQVTSL